MEMKNHHRYITIFLVAPKSITFLVICSVVSTNNHKVYPVYYVYKIY